MSIVIMSRPRRSNATFNPEVYGTVHALVRAGTAVQYEETSTPSTATTDGNPVGTLVNQSPQSPNPIDNFIAPSDAARPTYRADAYSSGFPAWEFDGTDDVLRFANTQLAFSEIGGNGGTMICVFNAVTKVNTYGVVSLNGVPNDNQHQSVFHNPSGYLGYFNRDEDEDGGAGLAGGSDWYTDAYNYVTNGGPHFMGVTFKTQANVFEVTYGTTDKSDEADTYSQNIADLEDPSSMYVGGDAWAGGASQHFGQGFVHCIILYQGQLAEPLIDEILTRIEEEWYT